jgi:hypothetical protein
VLDLVEAVLSKFGFAKYDIMLSTRPEKSVGTDDIWTAATDALVGALTGARVLGALCPLFGDVIICVGGELSLRLSALLSLAS